MSEFFFGLGNGFVTAKVRDRLNRIAKRHGAWFVRYKEPGRGTWRYWLACPNRGNPFDQAIARAVLDDVEASGLLTSEDK